MSITSSLFSGISGLKALGNAMTVIGDNIANVNTVGFKENRVTFQDVVSQMTGSSSVRSEVGRGTMLSDISSSFSQGSFESTESATDLAIGGDGFFTLRNPLTQNHLYTRAGEFRFDENGNFVNPSGNIVRGWELDADTGDDIGQITDIRLETFTSPPAETTEITTILNLDSNATNHSSGLNTSLSGQWDGTATDNIGDDDYEYQTTLKIYDSLGDTNDITLYFDLGETAADPVWEYIVTCAPAEDLRAVAVAADDVNLGLLARGTITFDGETGTIAGADCVTCSTNNGAGVWTALDKADAVDAPGGYFAFSPSFINGATLNIGLNFGTRYNGTAFVNDALSSSQYASLSATILQSSDGYSTGDMQSVVVGTDGVVTGAYSNGEDIPLYRLSLAKFQNNQGLAKVGGNLYRATRNSGEPVSGTPGTNGLGTITPNSLEQSNVDIATEFVKMIMTQRGFQANSKIITVTDQMLADLINLKR